jgi:oxygen-independent coproporphyrinogen-3 oxidase
VDPRSVVGENETILPTLKQLGISRVSLGIQDFDATVQEAIGRRQSRHVSIHVFRQCQALGFESINFDLVYGLPNQTVASFQNTVSQLIALRPHRIALFSFAYLPELKPHQKAIPATLLPSPEEKFQIYLNAREQLLEGGYIAIGLDHFALPNDPLCIGLQQGHLRRTFQGYTVQEGHEVIGLGMTGISDFGSSFFQHAKTLPEYESAIRREEFPTTRGIHLTADDLCRRSVIEQLMCRGNVVKQEFERQHAVSFDAYFPEAEKRLHPLVDDGLVIITPHLIEVTPRGQLFLRNVASCFDAYLSTTTVHSRAI